MAEAYHTVHQQRKYLNVFFSQKTWKYWNQPRPYRFPPEQQKSTGTSPRATDLPDSLAFADNMMKGDNAAGEACVDDHVVLWIVKITRENELDDALQCRLFTVPA
jgi:hypothetical protein